MTDSQKPYSVELHGNITIVRFVAGHALAKSDVINAFQDEIKIDTDFSMDDIWDLRGCTIASGFSFEDVMEVKSHILRFDQGGREGRRTAIVVDGDATFGVARMFEATADQLPAHVRVFRDETEALLWVQGA